MYKLKPSTELFRNHKAAQVLSDQSAFEVLQTSAGQSLFFGIGDSKSFYLSAEQNNSKTGWTPVDLTTELATRHPGQTVAAKSFAVRQSVATGNIQVVQVVHLKEANTDVLHILTELSSDPSAPWIQSATHRAWIVRPYDDPGNPLSNVDIAYVALPAGDNAEQISRVVAGVRSNTTGFIQTYTIDLNSADGAWKGSGTAEDFDHVIDMQVGKPDKALSPGLYQLYTQNDAASLTFRPWHGLFGAPPDVTKLNAPTGASSIACAPTGQAGGTDLYVAGAGAIHFFAADNQSSQSSGVQIISSPIISNVTSLRVHVGDGGLSIWGRNNSGTIFCSHRRAGQQQWSAPVPILQNADRLATMLDRKTLAGTLFAHTAGQQIVKLTQDSVTTLWRKQNILLPHLKVGEMVEFHAWTTRVEVRDENGLPPAKPSDAKVLLTSTSPCSVYVNDTYLSLSPELPVEVTPDATGAFTIVQQAHTLGAVCYKLAEGDGPVTNVNPMVEKIAGMAAIGSGADLRKLHVTDESGHVTPLVPPGVPTANSDAVASGIAQFVKSARALPPDGSIVHVPRTTSAAVDPAASYAWGMIFTGGRISYHESAAQLAAMGFSSSAGIASSETGFEFGDGDTDVFEALSGDIFRWMEDSATAVESFVVQVEGGVTSFFVRIGGSLYRFAMKCVSDVMHAVQFILKTIEVEWDKLVQWLGFVFSWPDIVRTQKVLTNVIRQSVVAAAGSISTIRHEVEGKIKDLENTVNHWTGLPDVKGTIGDIRSAGKRPAGADTPQAHYGLSLLKNNILSASSDYSPPMPSGTGLEELLNKVLFALNEEKQDFEHACNSIKTEILDHVGSLSANEIMTKFIGIVLDLGIETIANLALTIIDILAILVDGIVGSLNSTIELPVLGPLYSSAANEIRMRFSALDLVGFLVAIPVTIVVKATAGVAPFPDDSFTRELINASGLESLRALFTGQHLSAGFAGGSAASLSMTKSQASMFNFVGAIAASTATGLIMVLGTIKFSYPEGLSRVLSAAVSFFYAVSYVAYVAPDFTAYITTETKKLTLDVIWNFDIACLSVIKTFVDNASSSYVWGVISPLVEAIINVFWQVPVTLVLFRGPTAADVVGFFGNTAFDLGGFITPGTSYPTDERVKAAFFLSTVVLAAIYGELTLIQGLMVFGPITVGASV